MAADKVLLEKRKLFIQAVNEGTINGLLDELLERKVLSREEMQIIIHQNPTDMKKARALIDSVVPKGHRACQICISYICDADAFLAEKIGLSTGPQSGNDFNAQDLPAVAPFLQVSQAVQDKPADLTSSEPRGILKLCSPETAQRIWNEKSAEVLWSERKDQE